MADLDPTESRANRDMQPKREVFSVDNIALNHLRANPIKKFFSKKDQFMKRDSSHVANCLNNLNVTMAYENLTALELIKELKIKHDIENGKEIK